MPLLTILPFALLLAAVLGLWLHRLAWMTALAAAVFAGYCTGALRDLAAVWIAIAALLCAWYARSRSAGNRVQRLIAGLALFCFGLAMAVPLLPGFVRIELVPAQVLSEGAAPYVLAVGFPKVTLGILLLGLVEPAVLGHRGLGGALRSAVPVFLVTLLLVTACALALGYTAFAPHWSPLFLWWAPINLFFTCLAEEAFFRGFVQGELAPPGSRTARNILALVVAALLFGLAHYAGAATYVFAGLVAGLGYGWAFLRTQRIEAAMAVHFGVNAVHFLFFVYPRLA